MPRGHHVARCMHCGKEWVVGDCIPSICPECEAAGHKGLSIDCPICFPSAIDAPQPIKRRPKEPQWSVSVQCDGQHIVTISTNGVGGKHLTADDEKIIHMAIRHLQSFIGDAKRG